MYIVYYRGDVETIETFEYIKIEGDFIRVECKDIVKPGVRFSGSRSIKKQDVKKIITAYGVQVYPEKKKSIQAFVK